MSADKTALLGGSGRVKSLGSISNFNNLTEAYIKYFDI
jgi:hypothetical protein